MGILNRMQRKPKTEYELWVERPGEDPTRIEIKGNPGSALDAATEAILASSPKDRVLLYLSPRTPDSQPVDEWGGEFL